MSSRPKLPEVLYFPGYPQPTLCFFRVVEFRPAKVGEFFVSGAIPEVYEARGLSETRYWIVEPTYKAVKKTIYVRGEQIRKVARA